MELRQLRYFIVLAEELHFQRAARRVELTQPALSYQLKSIEKQMGVQLVKRDRRNVELTPAGKHFYHGAVKLIKSLDNLTLETKDIAGSETQTLNVGYAEYLNLDPVVNSIMETRRTFPHIHIQQIDIPTLDVIVAVEQKDIDIGFTPFPVSQHNLASKLLIKGYWSLVVPKSHKFADLSQIPINLLNNEPLIFFDRAVNPNMFSWWMRQFEQHNAVENVVFESKQVVTALNMVESNMGLYIVASYIVPQLPESLIKLPIKLEENSIQINAVWHEDNTSLALTRFLNVLLKSTDVKQS